MPRKREARLRTPREPSRKRPRTPWQRRRNDALAAAGFSRADVWRRAVNDGHRCAMTAVYAVLDGYYRSAPIEDAYCALTGTQRAVMFPNDEPKYRTGKRAKFDEGTHGDGEGEGDDGAPAGQVIDLMEALKTSLAETRRENDASKTTTPPVSKD